MRIAIVTHSLPQPNSNGGPMTVWTILNTLLDKGHEVRVIVLLYHNEAFYDTGRLKVVEKTGARVSILRIEKSEKKRTIWNFIPSALSIESNFPTYKQQGAAIKVLRQLDPQVVFMYHWDSIALLHGVTTWPKMGVTGDPWHLPGLRAWQNMKREFTTRYLKLSAVNIINYLTKPLVMVRLHLNCDVRGTFQAAESRAMRKMGVSNCTYYRTSVMPPDRPTGHNLVGQTNSPTILLGPSNLEATSTLAGINFFAEKIYPLLQERLKGVDFTVRIVGEGAIPKSLASILPSDRIQVVGRIEPPDTEFYRCRLQLVPTPFVLGIRVRIITGMAFGCAIVAHRSESENIPELKSGINCLLGANGEEIASHIATLVRNPEVAISLGNAARRTYETMFIPSVASAALVADLEGLGSRMNSKNRSQ